MILALKVVHVGVAAAWFGQKLLVAADLSDSLDSWAESVSPAGRLRRAERLGIATGSEHSSP